MPSCEEDGVRQDGVRRAGHPHRLCGPAGSRAREHKKGLSDLQDWPEGRCLPRPRRCLGSVAVPCLAATAFGWCPARRRRPSAQDSQGSAHGLQLGRGGVLPRAWTMMNGPATKPCGPSSMPSRVPCPCGRGARGTITEPSKRGLIDAGRAIQCWGGHRGGQEGPARVPGGRRCARQAASPACGCRLRWTTASRPSRLIRASNRRPSAATASIRQSEN